MKLHQLNKDCNPKIRIVTPVSDDELKDRKLNYPLLNKAQFSKRYNKLLYVPVEIEFNEVTYPIQANFCTNPFCRWYGQPQLRYTTILGKPSRYKIVGTENNKIIQCNNIDDSDFFKPVLNDNIVPFSNWGLAKEIYRLLDINTVVPIESEYIFHRDSCTQTLVNPFDNPEGFYKRGKSSSNSQKYQCKQCKKITNVLPSQHECFTYNQKRNDILPMFMKLILSRTPVTRVCEILNIGPGTYYHKLEWIYRRCLEFLDRHETKKFNNIHFKSLWLNTDKFTYFLNNTRKKGHGKEFCNNREKPLFPTAIVATSDSYSKYIFRADVAFDYTINKDDVIKDIEEYGEDKLYTYLQKNGLYKYTQTKRDNLHSSTKELMLKNIESRGEYVDGLHVNSSYTAYAQYWLINHLIDTDKLYIVTDADPALISVLLRVFKEEVMNNKVNVFTCSIDKSLSKYDAYKRYLEHKEKLDDWKDKNNLKCNFSEAAISMLSNEISANGIFRVKNINGINCTVGTNKPIKHPYPHKDEGERYINCVTDLSYLNNLELAKLLYKVDMRSINTFFNQIRRKVSILERPLYGGRSEGKSYIYSNFNPKYAQYIVTILRTYLNFCDTYKYKGLKITPAMRLGIATKVYTINDILYLK